MKYVEIPPDVCRSVCGASDSVEPSIFRYFLDNLWSRRLLESEVRSDLKGLVERQLVYRQLVLPSYGSDGLVQKRDVIDGYLRSIGEYKPVLLKALPAYLYMMALHISDGGRQPPRITNGIMPMGSSLSPYMKRVVESAFGCEVHEDYGCAELGPMAAECGARDGLHVFAGLYYVEVVRNGRPAGDGEVGSVLVTDLYNYAMPFIRYDIGDVAIVRRTPCGCGLDGRRLEVQGRLQDCLVAEDGTVITADRVADSVLPCRGVLAFQLESGENGGLHLQVVPRGEEQPDLDRIAQILAGLLQRNAKINARLVPTILPEAGGKFRFVKNHAAKNML
jgi:phenylacetate-CoA ligase